MIRLPGLRLGTLIGIAWQAIPCAAGEIAPLLAQGSAPVLQPTKSYLVEAAVVIVLFGAAIFAVCRSSRRS